MSEHGDFSNPLKSAFSIERYDSGWEKQYMLKLEATKSVKKWTKNHGITIQYVTEAGNVRGYRPDFLIEKIDGSIELHEVKGTQMLRHPDTIRKHEAATNWCKKRDMNFLIITKK